jgi:hypothetical protein
MLLSADAVEQGRMILQLRLAPRESDDKSNQVLRNVDPIDKKVNLGVWETRKISADSVSRTEQYRQTDASCRRDPLHLHVRRDTAVANHGS